MIYASPVSRRSYDLTIFLVGFSINKVIICDIVMFHKGDLAFSSISCKNYPLRYSQAVGTPHYLHSSRSFTALHIKIRFSNWCTDIHTFSREITVWGQFLVSRGGLATHANNRTEWADKRRWLRRQCERYRCCLVHTSFTSLSSLPIPSTRLPT